MAEYTEEQISDIKDRVAKAAEFLKGLQLNVATQVSKQRIEFEGQELFVDKVIPYLQDLRYAGTISPIQSDDLKKDESNPAI